MTLSTYLNRDITKILETVGLNDGETTHDLRHRISLLSEENNLLLAHLEELKVCLFLLLFSCVFLLVLCSF